MSQRFALRYSRFNRIVLTVLGMGPRRAFVEVDETKLRVGMGWSFAAVVPRSSVRDVWPGPQVKLTAGVHGWRGRWLVNGAGDHIVSIQIEPSARARVLGVPVSLRELLVSLEEPPALAEALGFDLP